jgi:hypothetical protein
MFNYILFFPFKNLEHSSNPEPIDLRKGVKEAGKNEHYLDTGIQLRSDQVASESDDRVRNRWTKAHSLVLANSR